MRINQYGDRWNFELRKRNISNSDAKCGFCGCEFDFKEHEVIRQVSVRLSMKRGMVRCPCCGEEVTIWKRHWPVYEGASR